MTPLRPGVFVDRDGTVLTERHYLADPAKVELLPGALGALAELRAGGYAIVLVTNQSGIARGLYSEADYREVATHLDRLLEEAGVLPDATQYCPHHPDYSGPCECRKPGTGMYEAAAQKLGLDPVSSYYVGDKITDVLPAQALGGTGILVRTGYGALHERDLPAGIEAVDDLAAAARLILGESA